MPLKVFEALEFDFFLPTAIWDHQAVCAFRDDLAAVEPGATIQHANTGLWNGEAEGTRVYRLLLRVGAFDPDRVTRWLHRRVGRLADELAGDAAARQDEVRFTRRSVQVFTATPPPKGRSRRASSPADRPSSPARRRLAASGGAKGRSRRRG